MRANCGQIAARMELKFSPGRAEYSHFTVSN